MTAESSIAMTLSRVGRLLEQVLNRLDDRIAGLLLELGDTKLAAAETGRIVDRELREQLLQMLADEVPEIVSETIIGDYPTLAAFADEIEDAIADHFEDAVVPLVDNLAAEAVRTVEKAAAADTENLLEAADAIGDALDTSFGRQSVAIERVVRDLGETALKKAADEAGEALGSEMVFVYVGPSDGRTRAYCQARAGKYLTSQQVDELSPFERYHCRHGLAPILKEDAVADGIPAFKS